MTRVGHCSMVPFAAFVLLFVVQCFARPTHMLQCFCLVCLGPIGSFTCLMRNDPRDEFSSSLFPVPICGNTENGVLSNGLRFFLGDLVEVQRDSEWVSARVSRAPTDERPNDGSFRASWQGRLDGDKLKADLKDQLPWRVFIPHSGSNI